MFRILGIALILTISCLSPARGQAPLTSPLGVEGQTLLRAFYEYDKTIPLEARVVARTVEDDVIHEKIVYRGPRAFMVSGLLEIPTVGEGPFPCVLLVHGWSGSKDSWWKDGGYLSGGNARKALLAAGYAIFALDAQAHGDRIAENDYHPVNSYEDPTGPWRKNYFTLRDIVTQTLLDYRRGIDYLETRTDINATRLGIVGYSMGGFHAVSLTAVDPRIKVSVGCVVPVSWREDPILDPANYVQGIGSRPFMMLQGKTDGLCNEEEAKALFSHFDGETAQLVLYDSGHKLPVDWVGEAIPWLAARL